MTWLDDTEINGYMDLINKHRSENKIYASDSHIITRFLARSLAGGGDRIESFWNSMRKKNIKLEELSKWIIPINDDNVHWLLAVVMIKEHLIVFYDSLSDGPPSLHMKFATTIRQMLKMYGSKYSIKSFQAWPWVSCSQKCFLELQTDAYSCGIYCIAAADINSLNPNELIYEISIDNLRRYRQRIMEFIASGTISEAQALTTFNSRIIEYASPVRAVDPHFGADIPRTKRSIWKLLTNLKKCKKEEIMCDFPRYAIAWHMTTDNILRLYRMTDVISQKISFSGTRVCLHIPNYDCKPLIFERLLLSSLIKPDVRISLHIICEYDFPDLGLVPLEDFDPSSPIFASQNYYEIACLSESIHALRQTLGSSIASLTIKNSLPEDGCDLLLTRSYSMSDDLDLCIRRTSLRQSGGACIYIYEFESIQLAFRASRDTLCMRPLESNLLPRRLNPCYSEEHVERFLF